MLSCDRAGKLASFAGDKCTRSSKVINKQNEQFRVSNVSCVMTAFIELATRMDFSLKIKAGQLE